MRTRLAGKMFFAFDAHQRSGLKADHHVWKSPKTERNRITCFTHEWCYQGMYQPLTVILHTSWKENLALWFPYLDLQEQNRWRSCRQSNGIQCVCAVKSPHGVLEQLRQDVVQRQRDEGEASCYVSVDSHSGRVTVLMLTQTPEGHVRSVYSSANDPI